MCDGTSHSTALLFKYKHFNLYSFGGKRVSVKYFNLYSVGLVHYLYDIKDEIVLLLLT